MIPDSLEPTPLIDPADRAPVEVWPITAPSRWRAIVVTWRWLIWIVDELWRALRGQRDPAGRGRRLRALLERLGGLWVKVGQLLSLRIDLFDVDFCQELALLQDRVHGFPGDIACRLVEAELGVSIDRVFSELDDQPIAAASIGQVHRARLRDGQLVAVKVRRPFVEETLARELALLRVIFTLLDRLRIAPFMRWRQMRWELEEILREELDYRREASSMQRLRDTLNGRTMYVPRVYDELSTARVLVMEFVSGVLMADYIVTLRANPRRVREWERENDIDPHRVVRRFSYSILKQIIEDNLYHGDLHPGNIVLLRGSRVALLDFGAVGFTDSDYLERFRLLMEALTRQEFERAADVALLMTAGLPDVDLEPIRAELVRELLAWGLRTGVAGLPYSVKSVDAVNVALMRILFKYRITFEWGFLRIRRALATMDATAMHLYADADYTKITKAYFRRAARRRLGRRANPSAAIGTLARTVDDGEVLRQIGELTELALTIERRRLRLAQATLSGASLVVIVLARWIRPAAIALAIAGGLAIAAQHGPASSRAAMSAISMGLADRAPILDWQIWIALSLAALTMARTAKAVMPSRASSRATSGRRRTGIASP